MSTVEVKVSNLPVDVSASEAVTLVYGEEIKTIQDAIGSGLNTLVRADGRVNKILISLIRNWQKAENKKTSKALEKKVKLISGTPPSGSEEQAQGSLIGNMVKSLRKELVEGTSRVLVIITHIDLIATTTKSGLTSEAKESMAAMQLKYPGAQILAFCDVDFDLPDVMTKFFGRVVTIEGMSRESIQKVVTQKEARKFTCTEVFNPYQLYPYVSGLNAPRFREVMAYVCDGVSDYSEQNPYTRDNIFKSIRAITAGGSEVELPDVDLDKDIGGYEPVKKQIKEDILEMLRYSQTLKDPQSIKEIEDIVPRGLIFEGPPGTGKTLFAKALAKALGAAVIIISGPELKSKWVGESEENIRKVFRQARQIAPAIIIFDEMDSIATARGSDSSSGVNHGMVNQFLTELDGFRGDEMVFVVGTTNFASALDPAFRRPGRFEKIIHIGYPDEKAREKIIQIYNKKLRLNMDDDVVEHLVERTGEFFDPVRQTRYAGDHIKAVCRELKRRLVRSKGSLEIDAAEINDAMKRDFKKPVFNEEERQTVSIHEVGHALAGHLLEFADSAKELTIDSKISEALGYMVRDDKGKTNKNVIRREQMLDTICVFLAGRAAEKVVLNHITVGASDDLNRATEYARAMILELGFGDTLGVATGRNAFTGQSEDREMSEVQRQKLEAQIETILKEQYDRAEKLITENRKMYDEMVEALLVEKTLDKDRINEIWGEPNEPNYTLPYKVVENNDEEE